MRTIAILFLAAVALVAGCHLTEYVTPKTGKGTAYPYGYDRTACGPVTCAGGYRCVAAGRCQLVSYEGPYLPPMGAHAPDAGR